MSGSSKEAQDKWIQRVLGVTATGSGETGKGGSSEEFRRAWSAAWTGWLDAQDTVDAQIDMLARALRSTDDEDFAILADSGLPTLFESARPPLMAAGLQIGRVGDGDLAASAKQAQKALVGMATLLGSSDKIAACDAIDPGEFGVAVSIRATLGPALKALADAVKRAPK